MSGAVVAVMITNVSAFRGLQRVNPSLDDLEDFGDAFPGRERFATERVALAVSTQVKRVANYFIDLHTGGDRFRQLPFRASTRSPAACPRAATTISRAASGFPRSGATRPASSRATPRRSSAPPASRHSCSRSGADSRSKPADLRLQADAVRSFLRKVGVLPGEPARVAAYTVVTGYRIVTNSRGGFFEAAVKPGDPIQEGSVLGRIFNVYGDNVETLTAPAGSQIVLGVSTYPAAPTGGWLFELGTGLSTAPSAPAGNSSSKYAKEPVFTRPRHD